MQFPFDLNLEIDGMHLCQLEGFAIIERCHQDRDDWNLGDIYLHNGMSRAHPDYEERKISHEHPIWYVQVLTYLLNTKRDEIDWEWGQHLNACKANMEAA